MARSRCRLWWPDKLTSRDPGSSLLLFGWFIDSVTSIDIVVATTASPCDISLYLRRSDLQEMLHSTNGKMPLTLESTKFSLLGHCATEYSGKISTMLCNYRKNSPSESINQQPQCLGVEPNPRSAISCDSVNQSDQESSKEATLGGNFARWNCGCEKLDKLIESCRQSLSKDSVWIQLLCRSQRTLCKEIIWVPQFHHMHLHGQMLSTNDVHVSNNI